MSFFADNYSNRSGATSRSSLYRPSSRASLPSFLSLQNSSYRVLQDDEDKWLTEIPVDPIFMEHTDKINVKVVKYSLQISCEVFDTIGEGRMAKTQQYKLNKRITLPDDCKLETLDVVVDKKRTVVRIVCDKIPGHSRCMSRNSRASRAGSRMGSALGFYDQPRSGLATPNMFAPTFGQPSRPDSRSSFYGEMNGGRNINGTSKTELDEVENSDKRWESRLVLDENFAGEVGSIRSYKRNDFILIEKKIPIPSDVQLGTVSTFIKDGVVVIMGMKKQSQSTFVPNGAGDLKIDTATQAQIHREMTSSLNATDLTPSRPTMIAPPAAVKQPESPQSPEKPLAPIIPPEQKTESAKSVEKNAIEKPAEARTEEKTQPAKPEEEKFAAKTESFQLQEHLGRSSSRATPTQRSRNVSQSSVSSRRSSISEAHKAATDAESQEDESGNGPVCEIIENSDKKWEVRLNVPAMFLEAPENVKVKVSKKKISIKASVTKSSKTSTLSREVNIPSDVNQKKLSVEAVKEDGALILRCPKHQK
ncbi:Oidioi.mRNA.OKI2018_I69.XSR.g15286.t1.cds [Oikopleura dioica]|uniref:Oidioi.mRNA.OKI2018_I69.XSR.g15286.t1.cds n=1 Tax=Oikopleura dioica TaxID=34765 RepID=A0ABN7SJR3_OIKDI|nr:Oidioi.mRNA.OKI2018_I69.XSR.g15286.t1.cds [Oikopleura dioica]